MNKYGEFYKNGWEYHINIPETPKPWYNYLFNDKFHSIISQTGGGFNYAVDPKVNRILRYDNVDNDLSGRYLFVKEDEKKIWSAGWQPLKTKLTKFKTIHAPGYTSIESEKGHLQSKMTFFVPLEDTIEFWKIRLKNKSKKKKYISTYSYIDVIAGDVDMEARYRNIMKLYNRTGYAEKYKTLFFYKEPSTAREKSNYSFFLSSLKPASFETEKINFLGQYRTIETAIGCNNKKLSNTLVRGEDMVGVFQNRIVLNPGEEKEFFYIIGFAEKKTEIGKIFKKYQSLKSVDIQLDKVKHYWEKELKKLWINTGNEDLDRMINIWGKYQLFAITRWRGTSPYHGTEGGLGYRDLAQDVEGVAGLDLSLAKEKIIDLLHFQYNNGNAVSGFSVLEGAWDENAENKLVSGKSDVAIWLPNAVVKYMKESGDFDFLNEKINYLNGGKDSVYAHIVKAVEYVASTTGKHGLPLIKIADWNDAYDKLGRQNKGESVWLGEAVCWAASIVKELADYLKDTKVSHKMQLIYDNMKNKVNKFGWNKNHYLAAYNDDYRKIGLDSIPLNSQTWAIIGKVVSEKRKKSVLQSIDKLDTPYGPVLFSPPYHKYESDIGRVSAFAEGTKENAAVFSHAVAFKVVADVLAGRNEKAYNTMLKLLPNSSAKQNIEKYKVEPYVWSEYVIGKGNKYFGQGAFTWNTGTAVWTYIAVTEWIVGVKPGFDGLIIEPHLPHGIKEVYLKRIYRNCSYEIYIKKNGRKKIMIDGQEYKNKSIPIFKDEKTHKINFFY